MCVFCFDRCIVVTLISWLPASDSALKWSASSLPCIEMCKCKKVRSHWLMLYIQCVKKSPFIFWHNSVKNIFFKILVCNVLRRPDTRQTTLGSAKSDSFNNIQE